MKTVFTIDYYIADNSHVAVDLMAGGCGQSRRVTASRAGDTLWRAESEIPDHIDEITYSYVIVDAEGNVVRREAGAPRRIVKSGNIALTECRDRWHDEPADKPLRTSAFTRCFTRRPNPTASAVKFHEAKVSLTVEAPAILPGATLAVCGESESLGKWDPAKALRMNDAGFPTWCIELDLPQQPVEFKFVTVDSDSGHIINWEEGPNRRIDPIDTCGSHLAIDCAEPKFATEPWRGAGTAIPVFSIRTRDDFGVGDFHSLRKMAQWCAATGQRVIQVLPLNDTTMTGTWLDSYPYNANSTFALHPMYIHPDGIGTLNEPARRDHYAAIAAELRALKDVDYERVTRTKDLLVRELYAQEGDRVVASEDFRNFVNANKGWLIPYAAFRLLRDRYNTAWTGAWGEYSVYNATKVAALVKDNSREINYHCFVQYFLSRQLSETLEYARSIGVTIKGDIPIGISRTSVDAWISPELFNLDCQAGAPPDFFAVHGQNWGFPTYNWNRMKLDGYAWWKERFRTMARYFDLYRIDHVLGFFRIWEIPRSALHGLLGYFNPALPFSPKEMERVYRFTFIPGEHTEPYITDRMITATFGNMADEVRSLYLKRIENCARYCLRPEFDTQRKIADYFGTDGENCVRDGLMNLLDEVLFIADPYEEGKFHPRINAQFTEVYHQLPHTAKHSFDLLYDDFFYHRHNDFWRENAMKKLPTLIDSTGMMACAEDLGMIPACVPDVLSRMEILSLEIERMPKDFHCRFADPAAYPYYSVCTTSTHDMSGIRQWWREDRATTQDYWNNVMHRQGEAPVDATPEICSDIIGRSLASPSMLCILPLQDWLATDAALRRDNPEEEVINIPARSGHYWRYRMHLCVEDLEASTYFNSSMRNMIERTKR